MRLAANYAIDRSAMNEADALGFAKITWSIIPSSFEFYWQPPSYPYDRARAKQLLAEAGYPSGFDGLGPRVEESGIGLIAGLAWSGPYEDVKLKGK